jgi:hypothetical protein
MLTLGGSLPMRKFMKMWEISYAMLILFEILLFVVIKEHSFHEML